MTRRVPPQLVANLIVLGLSGIVAQTVLLRELLVLFAGNELTLGVIIGAWVLCEASGALLAGRWSKRLSDPVIPFTLLTIAFTIIFPLSLWLARSYKSLAGIPPEMGVGIGTTMSASLLVMLPTGVLHGLLFIFGCILCREKTGRTADAVGIAYAWETLGTLVGGIVASYYLITRFDPFQVAILIALPACSAPLFLARQRRWLQGMLIAMLATTTLLFFGNGAEKLQKSSMARQWEGKEVVASRTSLYQNLTLTRSSGEQTFFSDGLPFLTTPVPDIAYVEELAHIPLLSHPAPRKVLILAGGPGGMIAEIVKHPTIERVDYLEIDPLLIQMLNTFQTPLTSRELADPRLHIFIRDMRPFLRETQERYDLVIINHPLPQTLLANRLFTRESFAAIRGVLADGGILALPWSGSAAYYNPELKRLNASLLATLAEVFPGRLLLPGETNLVMASLDARNPAIDPAILSKRLAERRLAVSLITPQHLEYRLDPAQVSWFCEEIAGVNVRINSDLSPQGLRYALAYRSLIFSPWLTSLLDHFAALPTTVGIGAILILFALLWLLAGRRQTLPVTIAIGGTGLGAMLMELFLMFGFQLSFGQVYHAAALLIAALMGGMAAGSLAMTRGLARLRRDKEFFLLLEGGLLLFALILAGFFSRLDTAAIAGSPILYPLFLLMLALAGFLAGMEFPLAIRIYGDSSPKSGIDQGAGIIYGADLAGACIGGVIGGFLLMPVYGLVTGSLLVALIKLSTLLIMTRSPGNLALRS